MTITNENITRARDLLNTLDDLGHVIELVALSIDGDDRRAAAIGQLGTLVREKAEAADICLGGPVDVKEALKQAIAREMAEIAQCAD